MEEILKAPDIIGDIEIDLNQHDVLLTARYQRPVLMVDGCLVSGISNFMLRHSLDYTTAVVTLNTDIKHNAFPFNDFDALRTLWSDNPEKLSVRDIVIKKHLGERFYQDHQKNCDG